MGAEMSHDHELVAECMMSAHIEQDLVASLREGGYKKLAQLLVDNGLSILPQGTHTLFAPTDEALGKVSFADFDPAEISNVLKYHVVPGHLLCEQSIRFFATRREVESIDTLFGKAQLWPSIVNGQPHINAVALSNSKNLFFNKKGVQGAIIGIDGVLLPCGNTGTTLASVLDGREVLKQAAAANLVGALTEPSAMFTIFAPPDQKLREALDGASQEAIAAALKAHVVHGCFTQATLLKMLADGRDHITIETLAGEEKCLKFKLDKKKVCIDTGNKLVAIKDELKNSNGVVHNVEEVLAPVQCGPLSIRPRARKTKK